MEDQWELYGYPSGIVMDNGPRFTSGEFESYLLDKDIHHYTTPVYHPQENGLVEVFNKFIKHGVQTFGGDKRFFDKLGNLLKSYRITPDSSGSKPTDVFLETEMRPEWAPNRDRPARRVSRQTPCNKGHVGQPANPTGGHGRRGVPTIDATTSSSKCHGYPKDFRLGKVL